MQGHVDDALYGFLLGTLVEAERHRIVVHLGDCARCTARLAQASDDLALLSLALAPAPAAPWLREGLEHALGEVSRFTDLLPRLSRHLGCSAQASQRALDVLDDPAAWAPSSAPGVAQLAQPMPNAVYLRAAPGSRLFWPGAEPRARIFVLQGRCRMGSAPIEPGDSLWLGRGVPIWAMSGPDVLYVGRPLALSAADVAHHGHHADARRNSA